MNQGTIVRADVDAFGVDVRIWVDDETGAHLAVCEVRLTADRLALWASELEQAVSDAAQLLLWGGDE